MTNSVFRLAATCFVLALTACTAITPPPGALDKSAHLRHQQQLASIEQFTLSGRMGAQTQQKGFSGKFRWVHSPQLDHLSFYSPLGSQVAEIVATPQGVTLTSSDRKTYTAQDIETLLEQTMGWTMPVSGLTDWALGRPTGQIYESIRWDEQGRLTHLQQQQWQIEFPAYTDINGTDLPSKIVLKSLRLDLKLLVEQWDIIR